MKKSPIFEKTLPSPWLLIFLFILSLPCLIYRFRHPQMTETQLFLNTINAYMEFLRG